MLSRWFVSFACIDRYALSSDNVRLRRLGNTRTAYRIIIVITIVWTIICSHRLIFYEIKGNVCGILTNTGAAMYHALYVIIGGFILPTVIMIACTVLIQRNLARKRRTRNQLVHVVSTTERERKQQSFDRQMLRLLFMQIVSYIILSLPQMINLVYNTIATTFPNKSADDLAIEGFVAFMAELMLYVFPVSSFYLYTLTSRTFRTELIKLFRSISNCWRQRLNNQINPTIGATTIIPYTVYRQPMVRICETLIVRQMRNDLNADDNRIPVH
ncbi:unnamed protein product [Rotaria sordida]|uniref:G-protein coupled receptors family 1 profile domain-containing protein n=1 Tax=Rotaria sordida TaxID=392033 RepID=A0A819T2N8_9BILA|nr:unnamed protein product [Rotaria sordida]CAF4081269.1 unnamed protein product [Rotaria sordida]